MNVYSRCILCNHWQTITLQAPISLSPSCESCGQILWSHMTETFQTELKLTQCPQCASPHLYRQKDFNRKLGLGLIVVGVATSVITYGLSLVVVTLLDLWLYRRVGEVGLCYQCHAQFREDPNVQTLSPFDLEIHDYYRSVTASSA